jgi:hypothetical protein
MPRIEEGTISPDWERLRRGRTWSKGLNREVFVAKGLNKVHSEEFEPRSQGGFRSRRFGSGLIQAPCGTP